MTILLALVLIVGSVGVLLGSAKPAGADTTVFQSGQVFASVGNSTVNVYDPSSGNLLDSLVDNTNEPYTVGTAFNSQGDLFVADDLNGDISEFGPDGTPLPTFATGLSNPISMVFDNQGNMYVGQQTTPYIAEFAPDGTRLTDIGPLQTELYGDDWIDLASDECTFYYTTEGTDILTYNKCTNTQGPNFNKVPFPSTDPSTGLPVNAFEVKLLSNGDVLVADSNAVLLLDSNGNVIQTYPCSGLPNCGGQLFAVSVDPSGTAFWTGDSASGDIYEINIATGALMQTIATHEGLLYGLSVAGNLSVATPPQTTTTVPSTLSIQPVTGNFSTPTPVSAVLTNPDTSTPIVNEPVTFTLNGNSSETCTADTDSTGTATCNITASEPSSSYTLTASFPGRLHSLNADRVRQHLQHVHGEPRHQLADLYRPDHGRERPTHHPVRHAHHEHAIVWHAAADQSRDLHGGLGHNGAVVQRGHRLQRRRQLYDFVARSASDERHHQFDLQW